MLNKETISQMLDKATNTELELFWIPKIVANQTNDEVRSEETIENNRIGLNGADGKIITSIFHQIQRGKHLSEKQAFTTKKRLKKYWKQFIPTEKTVMIKPTTPEAKPKTFLFDISEKFDCCKAPNMILTKKYTDREGEITHWDAYCKNCKATGMIYND